MKKKVPYVVIWCWVGSWTFWWIRTPVEQKAHVTCAPRRLAVWARKEPKPQCNWIAS